MIDQALPPEILEQILLNVDYEDIFNCSRASKYWQYITSDKHFRDRFCTSDSSWRIDPHELLENWDYNRREFELEKLHWLDYSESYEPKWKFEDQILARKLGKKLMDVDFNRAVYIHSALDIPLHKEELHPLERWLVKFRVEAHTYFSDAWQFAPINKGTLEDPLINLQVQKEVMPKSFTFKSGRVCELIVDLKECQVKTGSFTFTKVYQARYINDKSAWLGLSLDRSLFNITALLALPCLLNDYWKLNASIHYWTNLIIATISALFLLVSSVTTLWNQNNIYNINIRDRLHGRILLLASLIPVFLTVAFNLLLDIGFLVGCVLGSAGYFFIVLDMHEKNHPYARHMTALAILLSALLLDWKVLATSIGSGKIFSALAYNTALYLWLGVLILLHYAFMLSIQIISKSLITTQWNKSTLTDFAMCYVSVLLITIYTPDTTTIK